MMQLQEAVVYTLSKGNGCSECRGVENQLCGSELWKKQINEPLEATVFQLKTANDIKAKIYLHETQTVVSRKDLLTQLY